MAQIVKVAWFPADQGKLSIELREVEEKIKFIKIKK